MYFYISLYLCLGMEEVDILKNEKEIGLFRQNQQGLP